MEGEQLQLGPLLNLPMLGKILQVLMLTISSNTAEPLCWPFTSKKARLHFPHVTQSLNHSIVIVSIPCHPVTKLIAAQVYQQHESRVGNLPTRSDPSAYIQTLRQAILPLARRVYLSPSLLVRLVSRSSIYWGGHLHEHNFQVFAILGPWVSHRPK